MKRLLTPAVLLLVVLLSHGSPAAVLTVDDYGGADYLTIQEGVDAASWGDTVLVHPGTYTGYQYCGYGVASVCVRTSLTLVSSGGSGVTVIDGEGVVTNGICSESWDDVVIEGFTITNGLDRGRWGAAIAIHNGEIRNNILTGYGTGLSTDPLWYAAGGAEPPGLRDATKVIENNVITGNSTGIYLRTWALSETDVIGNTVSDNQSVGVSVHGIGNVGFVGNEVSGNTWGIIIRNPSHTAGSWFSIEMFDNRIVDNTYENVSIEMAEIEPGTRCDVTIGGSLEDANDIHGSLVNLGAEAYDVELFLDATYNFWGSIACSTFVPLFDIHENIPDSAFVFEPFTDETHTVTYDCEGVPVEHWSWGSIKALYR